MDLTQADLARQVSCSLSMLRKIERDERRPSEQLAELLADRLAIAGFQRESFLNLARGKLVQDPEITVAGDDALLPALVVVPDPERNPTPFVARERQMQWLQEQLDQALQGQGRMVFIAGEAGRGKSRLLIEFARLALETRPGIILAGGSSDILTGRGNPLLPFRDVFRVLVGDFENASLRGIIDQELATRLAQALPAISESLLECGPHLIDTLFPGAVLEARLAYHYLDDPETGDLLFRLQRQRARQRASEDRSIRQDHLFDEISTTLNALARRHPLMLMLDDLHWVDRSSAALLGHLAMRLQQSPILIVGSYRPEDLADRIPASSQDRQLRHPLKEVLSESLRQFGNNRIDLDHVKPGDELAFVNALLDVSANDFSEEFREELARLTEGNSLFVVEMLQDMKERGDIVQDASGHWRARASMKWDHFPARLEGVIEKRITRLPENQLDLLTVASVQGEIFFAEVIAEVKKLDPGELTHRLSADLGRRHHLILEEGVKRSGHERLSQYRFRHYLFQKYLYGRLAAAERMYLHEAVGNGLEGLFAGASDPDEVPAAQLARHYQEARLSLKASEYLFQAGQRAIRVLAFKEAAIYFEQGIREQEKLARTDEIIHLEFELRLALARALWHSGRVQEAVTAFTETIEIARTLHDPHALARAVLAYEEPRWKLNLDPQPSRQLIHEALAALGEEQSGARVRLMVSLCRSLLGSGEQDELRNTVDQALRIARQIDDLRARCDALDVQTHIDRRPEKAGVRLAAVQEMIATAAAIDEPERLTDGLDLYVYDLLELGQIELVDQIIALQRKIAHEIKQPLQIHIAAVFQTMRAILRGDFARAERLAEEAAHLSRQLGLAELDGIYGLHMFTIRREQGRLNEVEPVVKLIVANNPESSAWRPGLALIYCSLGMSEACREIFDALATDTFAFLPQDSLQVATLAYLSEVCAYLGDADRASILYRMLLPYEKRTVVVGGATACFGAAARYLGMLAATQEDWKAAERHFQDAMALDARLKAWPWLAHSQFMSAAMLLERGREQDCEKANMLLEEAARAAQRMGMASLVRQVSEVQSSW